MEYLESAHRLGLHIGLASSSPWEWVSGHLTRLGLIDYFEHITTRGQTARLKPHPDPYLALLSAFGLAPNEAIVLEDSAPGVAAGRSAGIFTVAVPNSLTRRLPLDHASLILNSLAELPLEQLIQRTNGAGKKSY
jgi:beta-phosphoglucomutase-like phosphatase (HAD superfamily)